MEPPAVDANELRLVTSQGPLSRDEATLLLDRAAERLEAGDFGGAFLLYRRVIGFDDHEVTAAALLGAGQARYRFDDEAGAVASWESVLELPETTSTYAAYREIAAARVREGDLQGAIGAYREAERRAPPEDKAEIATRLGWLAKETGNVRASRRYFARGRGATMPIVTYSILAITTVVSLTALLASEGQAIFDALALDKVGLVEGELWRLWTVILVHGGISVSAAEVFRATPAEALTGGLLHLGFNMYALWIAGPLVEQIYGSVRMLLVYLAAAAAGSVASFAFSTSADAQFGVGASGAIFGLFGILFVASRLHMPALDRRGRAILGQIGMLIVINIIIGFSLGGIDNFAHLGGLAAGLLLGVVFIPQAATLASSSQPATAGRVRRGFLATPAASLLSLGVLGVGLAAGFYMGFQAWSGV
ncbi:MAG: rhomboid family intramembrane serine protease [Chloroflexota bacterium]